MAKRRKPEKRAIDREVVDFLIKHIENPCEVNIGKAVYNIKEVYLREAERFLDHNNKEKLTDPIEIARLERVIKEQRAK